MIEALPNVVSNEEIQFKLTQKIIPSLVNSTSLIIHAQGSLEYTDSRISIQQMLGSEEGYNWIQNGKWMCFSKNSSLKASSINTTNASTIKNTPRTSLRQRTPSNIKIQTKRQFKKKLSFYNIQFNPAQSHSKQQTSRRKYSSLSKFKTKFLSHRQSLTAKKDQQSHPFNQILQIKQIILKSDEQRQRRYSNHIARGKFCSMNLGDISRSIPFWPVRKGLMIF